MLYVQPLIEATRPNQETRLEVLNAAMVSVAIRSLPPMHSADLSLLSGIDSLGHEAMDHIYDASMKQYVVPERIRTDNGTSFSSISGLGSANYP